ncbi:MAG TPA: glycosyltransferase family 39 protein [Gemmatimonadales bacterium]|nr:glycosyltransferase family 39 protein [Gemmatimonadales bacterium]
MAAAFASVVALSFILGTWGNRWGAPAVWYVDEVTKRAVLMVDHRTVNPHHFTYGALQRLLVAGGVVIPVRLYARLFDPKPQGDRKAMLAWRTRQDTRIVRGARTVTAFFFAVLVASTGLVGLLLFDRVTALLTALLLAITPQLVVLAHFATVDLTATAWYWLACLAALLYWQRGHAGWFYGACFLGGLALGTKADRLLVLVPLVVSYWLRRQRRAGVLLTGLVLMFPLAYVVANPALVTSTFEYLDGVSREILFNAVRGEGRVSYGLILEYARQGLGTPLFALSIIACCVAVVLALRAGRRQMLVWILATFIPYYLLMGRLMVMEWYVAFFYPPVFLLAAYGLVEGFRRLPRRAAFAAATPVALVIASTAVRTVRVPTVFENDAREAASAWIAANVPAGSTIELVGAVPALPPDQYRTFVARDVASCSFYQQTLDQLTEARSYRKLRAMIGAAEQWTAGLKGTRVPAAPREAWFDRFAQACARPWFSLPPGTDSVWLHPDFVLIVGDAVAKTLGPSGPSPPEYMLAARFDVPRWSDAVRPTGLVAMPVRIYQRSDTGVRDRGR